MEKIVYRKTLDVHKNGVQFMLQGFETADKISRRIEISLMASGDTIDLPLEQIKAIMYVTTPGATEPSINDCTIKDNTIIYDVLPITVEGITEMQIKLISTRPEGANGVLPSPRFAVEVSQSNTDDESAPQVTYTAIEEAIIKAESAYGSRLTSIELDADCVFRANYADGTMYETDVLKEFFLKGDALVSQSYAKGGTGIRTGEDTDNSMYYSNVSKSASIDAEKMRDDADEVLTEVRKHGVYTAFYIDFEKGEVEYISPSYKFNINQETGELEPIGEAYKYEDAISYYVDEWIRNNGGDYIALQNKIKAQESEIENNLKKEINGNTESILGIQSRIGSIDGNISSHTTTLAEYLDLINANTSSIGEVKQNLESVEKNAYRYYHFCRLYNSCVASDTYANDVANIDFQYFSIDNESTSDFDTMCERVSNYSAGWIPAKGYYTMYNGSTHEKFEVIALKISKFNENYTITALTRDWYGSFSSTRAMCDIATSDTVKFIQVLDTAIKQN